MYSGSIMAENTILKAVDRGVKLVVIDSRCTATAELADIHLRPIPGTDGALAHGMARVIITEGLQNQEYIDKYTSGYEEYKNYVMEFTPEKVEEITGVPKSLMHHINGVQNARAAMMLLALTGSFGVEGGSMPPGPGGVKMREAFLGTIHERVDVDQDLSHEEFPAWAKYVYFEIQVARIADYLSGKGAYPIHTLVAFGMNHHMWPRPDRIAEAVKGLDFFVNADIYMTETCKYADIVLPIQSCLEREQITVKGLDTLLYQGHVVEPAGESWTDMDVIAALAEKLGFTIGGDEPIHSNEDYMRKSITETGLTLEEIKAAPNGIKAKNIMPGRTTEQILKVNTPSGKIEFVSDVMGSCNAYGHEALPVYHDFREKLPMDEFPLILATGCRKTQLFHSRTYRLPWLTNLEEYPLVEVHPEDAKELGMSDGERVIIRTPIGSMELTLSVNSSCLKGTVSVYHGAGEKDINLLLDDNYLDPVSGFPGFKSYCCRLEKKGE